MTMEIYQDSSAARDGDYFPPSACPNVRKTQGIPRHPRKRQPKTRVPEPNCEGKHVRLRGAEKKRTRISKHSAAIRYFREEDRDDGAQAHLVAVSLNS